MNQEVGLQVVKQYEALVYKVLWDLGIRSSAHDFEDYFQEVECFLYLLGCEEEALEGFTERYAIGYLYQKVSWFIRDIRRKSIRSSGCLSMEEEQIEVAFIAPGYEDVELYEVLFAFHASLSVADQRKLTALLSNKSLSRQLRCYYRGQLREKFTLFFQTV